jgi:hypothetical protein
MALVSFVMCVLVGVVLRAVRIEKARDLVCAISGRSKGAGSHARSTADHFGIKAQEEARTCDRQLEAPSNGDLLRELNEA